MIGAFGKSGAGLSVRYGGSDAPRMSAFSSSVGGAIEYADTFGNGGGGGAAGGDDGTRFDGEGGGADER